jgi:uncharacterized LabA/DUF88 family protein
MIRQSEPVVKIPGKPVVEQVIAYIDGFNLYFGMRDAGYHRYFWLDLQKLAAGLLREGQDLRCTKYFTSRISGPSDKQRRQSTYLDALGTLDKNTFKMAFGKYQDNPTFCNRCNSSFIVSSEKMTDVNIAVAMMEDAFSNEFDTAILVSADSDLCGPVRAIRRLFPAKRVVVAFPPQRRSAELEKDATATFVIGKGKLAASQFPPVVSGKNGFQLLRPSKWA